MFTCQNNILKEDIKFTDLSKYYKLSQCINPGKSGARVYLVEKNGQKYFCKIIKLIKKERFLKEIYKKTLPEYRDILIGCELTQLKSKCFPKFYHWGYSEYLNPWNPKEKGQYLFMILQYLGHTNLKEILINQMKDNVKTKTNFSLKDFKNKNFSLKDFRKTMFQILDCCAIANRKLGFVHNDFKPDNIMIKNKKPIIIDFGLSYTKKYKRRDDIITYLDKLSYFLVPIRKKTHIDFNKSYFSPKLFGSKFKIDNIELDRIIRLINVGERVFNGHEIILNEKDYKYLNRASISFASKLIFIKKLYEKKINTI